MMDKLWAPWRATYIRNAKKRSRCVFCHASEGDDKEHLIFKTAYAVVVLNIYPYNNGHMLVSPRRHVKDFTSLRSEEVLDLFSALETARKALQKVLKPDGFNIGVNLGRAAGAGIPGHLHIHIVPRWIGDTNFMPAVNSTKIISQALEELHRHVRAALRGMKLEGVKVY